MPFNRAASGVGGRRFILAALTVEDLALNYNVESQVASQFPGATPTKARDKILLTLGAIDLVASSATGYAIDADAVHDLAIFNITMTTGGLLAGRGGKGGNGGIIPVGSGTAGIAGNSGGTAIRYGCVTNIKGTGEIRQGYGAGGGGGSNDGATKDGGGGGGGGAALGAKGIGGEGLDNNGNDGTAATVAAKGTGGAAVATGGFGGNGGESGTAAQAGETVSNAGGAAGSDGNAIDSQGFTRTEAVGITVTGPVI